MAGTGVFDADAHFVLPDGRQVVAGEFHDPLSGRECCLIETVPDALVGTSAAHGLLTEFARTSFPGAERVLVRLGDRAAEIPGFRDHLYYVRLDAPPADAAERPADPRVRPAAERDRPKVAGWLDRAFRDAMTAVADDPAPEATAAQAAAVAGHPDARSFVAECAGTDIGHITLITGQFDALTGRDYIELLDMLVEPDHPARSAAERRLVATAGAFAAAAGLPLIGHVVCGAPPARTGPAVLAALERRGWVFDHKYQTFDLR
ncbi:hypothetical protein [Actinomadura rayongensis]|uniref:N-acetyltransferase domain-containing protein n=1 Tax=Actinomadura rayongensis TaxID=1429076 RepID=A0A6I4W818_9ACTN|nr:hypothetical protein [Actinomadura rayongensis]MXQ66267.1 hypothetical protein [Actinomadura rayongensis]